MHSPAMTLRALDRPDEALAAAEEAARLLEPFARRHPDVFGDWMTEIMEEYQSLAEATEVEPYPIVADSLDERR